MNKLRQLFCLHKYGNEVLFYKVECFCESTLVHKLTLYKQVECKKCRKKKISIENTFKVESIKHLVKLKDLIEHHGAVPYYILKGEIEL